MRWLWLTLADPDPAENGQLLYSSGTIQAASDAGIELDVVGLSRPGARHTNGERTGTVHWRLAPHDIPSQWASIASRLPKLVWRTRNRAMRGIVAELLERHRWDAIVFDSIVIGWAIEPVISRFAHRIRPPLAYLAHNHEECVAEVVVGVEKNPLKRQLKRLDAVKMRALERTLCDEADVIASDSLDDRDKFAASWPGKTVIFLPPVYNGQRIAERVIGPEVPRRAIVLGSFDWLPKRVSLEEFLAVGARRLAGAGIELCIVGSAQENYLNRLRCQYRTATFTGRVAEVASHMAGARLALVPDTMSGFKLKTLDYVFNRVPILAIDGSIPSWPITKGDGVETYPNHAALTEGVIAIIDDFARLNALQERAYAACCNTFDGRTVAARLIESLSSVSPTMRRTAA